MTTPLPPNYNYVSGDKSTCLFLKKGEPIVSPLVVESPDGTEAVAINAGPGTTGLILVDNSNSTTVTQVSKRLQIVNKSAEQDSGAIQFFASTNSVGYILAPKDKNAAIRVYNSTFFTSTRSAEFGLSETGEGYVQTNGGSVFNVVEPTINLGGTGTPTINAVGTSGSGRVYDSLYNPTTTIGTASFNAGSISTQQAINLGYLSSGKYSLQARLFFQGDGSIQLGSTMSIWLQQLGIPNNYRAFSEISITPYMIGELPGSGETREPSWTSGVFDVPATAAEWTVYIKPTSTWDFGSEVSGGVYIQTVKHS